MNIPIQWELDGPFSYNHSCCRASVSYPLHIHNGFEIYWFLHGNVEYHVENLRYRLEPGDLLIIPGNELHRAVVAPGRSYERVTVHFSREFLAGFECASYDLLQCFHCVQACGANRISAEQAQKGGLVKLLQSLGELDASRAPQKDILIKVMLVRLLLAVNALYEQAASPAAQHDERIGALLRFINLHLADPLNLDTLAAHFFVNKYYLCHRFKEVMGMTITDYTHHKRVHKAYCMLQAGASATQAARSCGFSDYSHFYRTFKKYVGAAPSAVFRLWEQNDTSALCVTGADGADAPVRASSG